MELAANARSEQPACGLELVFTVAEEEGLRGARELDVSALRAPFGYVFDHATPIGEIITAAPTYNKVVAEFEGIEAHSGIRPEDGRIGDRGGGSGRGADGAGTARRGDDRERRSDRGRDGVERGRGQLQARLRGAKPRRGEGGGGDEVDRRCVHVGGDRDVAATSTSTCGRSSAATGSRPGAESLKVAREALSRRAATRRARSRPAAARMPTR